VQTNEEANRIKDIDAYSCKQKLISFAVPCYNSAAYMQNCIDSLLKGGDDVEIIIIDDGSTKDSTAMIADNYAMKYPSIVKVIHKENGGHGSGVNAGVRVATGVFFKVVDSDDWVDEEALMILLTRIKRDIRNENRLDLYVTNFVYEHVSDDTFFVRHYRKNFDEGVILEWNQIKPFKYSCSLLMHALLYRLETLKKSGTVLPEKTFYVDNIFAYKPLPFMKKICYLDIDLYRYFIGRDDQSVNPKIFIERYKQQIRVMEEMVKAYSWSNIKKMPKKLSRYMIHNLEIIMGNTIYFSVGKSTQERKDDLKSLWAFVKETDKKLYRKLRFGSWLFLVNYLAWPVRSRVMTVAYNYLRKRLKLG